MLIKTDTPAPSSLDGLLTIQQRVQHVTHGLILGWRDTHGGILLWEMAMMPEPAFIDLLMRTTVPGSLAEGFTRVQWGEVREGVIRYTKHVEVAGATFRKRKGDKMSLQDFRDLIRQQAEKAKRFWS